MVGDAPERGDLAWISFDPQAGHEQAGRRPGLVLTDVRYNRRLGLAIVAPITQQAKGYPFEVALPEGLAVGGVVLCDQAKSIDWRARRAEVVGRATDDLVNQVIGKLRSLLK